MPSLKTFSDPYIQLPLNAKVDLDKDTHDELETLLIHKTYNELRKIKDISVALALIR